MKKDQLSLGPAKLIIALFLLIAPFFTAAQGVKGRILNTNGEPLSFASLGVKGTSQGTAANADGYFQLSLASGTYDIHVQYLGYSALDTTIRIGNGMLEWNPVLQPESIALPEAIVNYGKEDPAYTIMRRAIAKAKYHAMQVDEYNAMVYVKGSGRLKKVPGLFRKKINKMLAEEGIDSTVAFTQESVSKLHYIRPDQYRDTVLSIRTIGDDNNTSPMGFIYSSFYEPVVFTGISPLAPDAFAHYTFEYLGYIQEGDQIINKIKVTPRGRGDSVFEGVLYIVDHVWSIHSLDLTTYVWGIQFDMQQRFEPVAPGVWLPVHEIYDVSGSVFGFGFEYRYFARLSDYDIKLNPDLEIPIYVLDEKKEKEESKLAEAKWKKADTEQAFDGLDPGEELTTKQLRKMLKEYEEQEIDALPELDTIPIENRNTQYIDSSAYQQDSLYWSTIRPMPLTEYEIKGYARQDSMALIPPEPDATENLSGQDTVSISLSDDGFSSNIKRRKKFEWSHLITGGRYALSEKTYLKLAGPLQSLNFNTVDGFHAGYEIEIGNAQNKKLNWSIAPLARYAFSREAINYEGKLKLFGKGWSLLVSGGDMTRQFSYDYPLSPIANSLYTLFSNRNYMKLYEQQYVKAEYKQKFSPGFGMEISGEYADRTPLVNTTDIVFFDSKKLLYTSNAPTHLAGGPDALDAHQAIISELSVWAQPFWRYRIDRGTKRKVYDRSPRMTINYRKGWNDAYDPFDLLTAQFEYKWQIGAGSLWSMKLAAGKFIGDQTPQYFHNFVHFPGNRLIATTFNPVHAFRMLDYYTYSTDDEYAYALFNYQFRRLALTQIETFRRKGIRENVIFNVLLTPEAQQYAEVGYALNYVFRVLRIEFVSSWQDYTYQDFAVRIGVATDFGSIFGAF